MEVNLVIVGQGISGTFLSLEAEKAGLSYVVIDDARPSTASKVAAGLINPVTGKRVVTTWMADELLPLAREAYGEAYLREFPLIIFYASNEARSLFLERQAEDPTYLDAPVAPDAWAGYFHDPFGYGIIRPAYVVNLSRFLADTRTDLGTRGLLQERTIAPDDLVIFPDGVQVGDLHAGHVIYCDGVAASGLPLFERLPFSLSKGEALIIEAPDLPSGYVFKKGLNAVPLGDHRFWVGASYEWNFTDALPSAAFRGRTESSLRQWLKVPFRTLDHVAAIRPTTVEQKPFVGVHPAHPAVGILGGMGTKGCSLAPFFARQLVAHITEGAPILPAADVRRFSRLLGSR